MVTLWAPLLMLPIEIAEPAVVEPPANRMTVPGIAPPPLTPALRLLPEGKLIKPLLAEPLVYAAIMMEPPLAPDRLDTPVMFKLLKAPLRSTLPPVALAPLKLMPVVVGVPGGMLPVSVPTLVTFAPAM